ncbi:MAG: nucleotidyltransferase family protein, partial [Sphingobacteriales bacterium]
MTSYNIIILAAGGSSRLGEAKQLLEYESESLLQHAVNQASETNA